MIKDKFNKMVATLLEKSTFQAERMRLYNGEHRAASIKITNDRKINQIAKASLDWPRIGVDQLAADCKFDAFEGDEFGATRLLVESGGDAAISSAITNSMIGAVAFIAIIPRDDDLPVLVPFSGAEATGIKTARGDALEYGLAVKRKNVNGIVDQWYFFQEGAIFILDDSGEVIDYVDLGVDAMPFIQFSYGEDAASAPFGASRISGACISALNSALRALTVKEQTTLINLLRGDLLILGGTGTTADSLDAEEFNSSVSALKTIYFDGDLSNIRKEQLQSVNVDELEKDFERFAAQYAAASSMNPTPFGVQPSNGSFSEGTLKEMSKPYLHIRRESRDSYGRSIRLLAIELFKIVAQTSDVSGLDDLETVFQEELQIEKIGSIGDAVQKMQTSSEDFSIPSNILRQIIGIPLRPEVINQELPNFEKSRLRFREISIDGL